MNFFRRQVIEIRKNPIPAQPTIGQFPVTIPHTEVPHGTVNRTAGIHRLALCRPSNAALN